MHQFLVNALQLDMPLGEAVAFPRVHVDTSGSEDRLAAEAGLDLPDTDLPLQTYPEINMYFGGVGAASFSVEDGFDVAADPRREGGVCIFDG
jgi:gamma-glutamyltranspeptidase